MNADDFCRRCGVELGDDEYPFCGLCHREDNEDQDEDEDEEAVDHATGDDECPRGGRVGRADRAEGGVMTHPDRERSTFERWCLFAVSWMIRLAMIPWPHFVGAVSLLAVSLYALSSGLIDWFIVTALGVGTFTTQGCMAWWIRRMMSRPIGRHGQS